jgi:hypothetical protein
MHDIKSKMMLHLFQENKSYDVETIALILCLHDAVHHVLNSHPTRKVTGWVNAASHEAEFRPHCSGQHNKKANSLKLVCK